MFRGLAAVGKRQIQIITTLKLSVIGKYGLVLDQASLTTVLSMLVVNVIMSKLYNRSIFTKCFCSLCVCIGGWLGRLRGVRFGKGCRWKAGWQASVCFDSSSELPREMTRRGRAGGWVSVGEGRARQCSTVGSTAHIYSSAARCGGGRARRTNDRWCRDGGAPKFSTSFHYNNYITGITDRGLGEPVAFQINLSKLNVN